MQIHLLALALEAVDRTALAAEFGLSAAEEPTGDASGRAGRAGPGPTEVGPGPRLAAPSRGGVA